jgi:hypothetical protein
MVDTTWDYSKYPLPHGYSYPVKRSDIEAAVSKAAATGLRSVGMFRWRPGRTVARADYRGDARRERWAMDGLVTVRFHAVPSDQRHHVEKLLLTGGLDRLFSWVADAGTAGNSWRGGDHYFQLLQSDTGLLEETDLWPR